MSPSDPDHVRTDGGDMTQSSVDGEGQADTTDRAAAFRSEADYSMSRADEIREMYDRKLYAPLQIILNDYRGVLGLSIILFYILMGTVGVAFVPRPSQSTDYFVPWFQDMTYPLGTDGAGRDLLAMTVHATPAMLQLMLGGAVFSISLAVLVGTVAGYRRGMTDRVLMTITDTILTLPSLPLLIIIVAVLDPRNPFLIGVILSVTAWAGGARSLRAQVLQIRSADHVEATRAMGISTGRNIQKNVLPELLPLIAINFMQGLIGILYAAVGLYFLAILPTQVVNWGVMLSTAFANVDFHSFGHFHYLMVPMIVISLFGVGTVYTAQAFDRVFNPRLRAKHAKTVRGGDEGDEELVDSGTLEAMAR